MGILDILHYPDERLRKKASAVESVTDETRQLIDDMFETMYDAPGIGLAATQVNVHKRVIVIDVSEEHDQPLTLINPEITWFSDEKESMDEGCLSVPGIYETVTRSDSIKFTALDRDGNSYEMEATGLLAVCVQHEIDHLNGRLFVDKLSILKRQRIKKKAEKELKLAKRAAN